MGPYLDAIHHKGQHSSSEPLFKIYYWFPFVQNVFFQGLCPILQFLTDIIHELSKSTSVSRCFCSFKIFENLRGKIYQKNGLQHLKVKLAEWQHILRLHCNHKHFQQPDLFQFVPASRCRSYFLSVSTTVEFFSTVKWQTPPAIIITICVLTVTGNVLT